MFLRSKEHVSQYKNKDKHSVMFKYVEKHHEKEEEKVEFEMTLTSLFRKPKSHIINEGICK